MFDVLDAIHVRGRLSPEHPAIMMHDRLVTFRMLVSGILSAERKIATLGLDRGKVVAVCIESAARHMIVALALAKAGYASVSLTPSSASQASSLHVGAVLAEVRVSTGSLFPVIVTDDWFTQDVDLASWDLTAVPDHRVVRIAQTSGSTGAAKILRSPKTHSHGDWPTCEAGPFFTRTASSACLDSKDTWASFTRWRC